MCQELKSLWQILRMKKLCFPRLMISIEVILTPLLEASRTTSLLCVVMANPFYSNSEIVQIFLCLQDYQQREFGTCNYLPNEIISVLLEYSYLRCPSNLMVCQWQIANFPNMTTIQLDEGKSNLMAPRIHLGDKVNFVFHDFLLRGCCRRDDVSMYQSYLSFVRMDQYVSIPSLAFEYDCVEIVKFHLSVLDYKITLFTLKNAIKNCAIRILKTLLAEAPIFLEINLDRIFRNKKLFRGKGFSFNQSTCKIIKCFIRRGRVDRFNYCFIEAIRTNTFVNFFIENKISYEHACTTAAQHNNFSAFIRLIEAGYPKHVNATLWAARNGNREIFEYALEHNFPLHRETLRYTEEYFPDLLEKLLAKGCSRIGEALLYPIETGNVSRVQKLLDYGFPVKFKSILYAVEFGHLKIFQIILPRWKEPYSHNRNRQLLEEAIPRLSMLRQLYQYGCRVDSDMFIFFYLAMERETKTSQEEKHEYYSLFFQNLSSPFTADSLEKQISREKEKIEIFLTHYPWQERSEDIRSLLYIIASKDLEKNFIFLLKRIENVIEIWNDREIIQHLYCSPQCLSYLLSRNYSITRDDFIAVLRGENEECFALFLQHRKEEQYWSACDIRAVITEFLSQPPRLSSMYHFPSIRKKKLQDLLSLNHHRLCLHMILAIKHGEYGYFEILLRDGYPYFDPYDSFIEMHQHVDFLKFIRKERRRPNHQKTHHILET